MDSIHRIKAQVYAAIGVAGGGFVRWPQRIDGLGLAHRPSAPNLFLELAKVSFSNTKVMEPS